MNFSPLQNHVKRTVYPYFSYFKNAQVKSTYSRYSAKRSLSHEASTKVRVRYAPSPTGSLHLGGLRTALFNYLFARSLGGEYHLRIEDTDQSRLVAGSADALQRVLEKCGLKAEPRVLVQSERLDVYQSHAEKLLENGHAYRCFCSSERLDEMRKDQRSRGVQSQYDRTCLGITPSEASARAAKGEAHTIRLKVDRQGTTMHNDLVLGKIGFDHSIVDDQVLVKSDKFPTYHLAAVVDDHQMGITHVIRGDEWLNSTSKHIMLYRAFGWDPPRFAHLPLLLNTDGSKLSKRQGDVAVEDFLRKGYLPSALINFVALLGWHPADGDTQEIFHSVDELESVFSLDQVNKSGAVVDRKRLDWINSKHIKHLCGMQAIPEYLVEEVQRDCSAIDGAKECYVEDTTYLSNMMRLLCERVTVVPDFAQFCGHFLYDQINYDDPSSQEMKRSVWHPEAQRGISLVFSTLVELDESTWKAKSIKQALNKVLIDLEIKKSPGKLYMPLRWATTGIKVGAALPNTFELLGRERVLTRLQEAIQYLDSH